MDATGVVDEVGVDAATRQGVFDTTALGEAQIPALADHLAPEVVAVDADRVVAPVTDRLMGLAGGLHIGTDAAVPEQIDGCLQDDFHELIGSELSGVGAEHFTHLRGELDPLRRSREDPSAGRQKRFVVQVPGRCW